MFKEHRGAADKGYCGAHTGENIGEFCSNIAGSKNDEVFGHSVNTHNIFIGVVLHTRLSDKSGDSGT